MTMCERAEKIENVFNTMPNYAVEAGRDMVNAHPTIQQNFMRGIVAFILAKAKGRYVDDRNAATYKLCIELAKTIRETVPENDIMESDGNECIYLPFI